MFLALLADEHPRRAVLAGLCGGLAALTRFDGLFLAPALVAAAILFPRRRRMLLIVLGAFVLVVAPGLLWKRAYYGSFLPNCGFAKTVVEPDLRAPLAFLGTVLAKSWETYTLWDFVFRSAALVCFFVAFGASCLLGRQRDERAALFCAIVTAFAVFTSAGFLNVQTWMPGYRYHVPLLPLLGIGAGLGFARLLRLRRAGETGWAAAAAVIALLAVAWPQIALGRGLMMYADFYRAWLHADHEPTGLWLREHAAKDATIAVYDAGLVPYLSERPTIDLGGLNDRTIATLVKRGRQAEAAEYVLDRKPAYLVLAPRFPVDVTLYAHPRFQRDYRLLFVSGRPGVPAEYHLFLYQRN